ncbi:MAG: hypothetical protein AAF532_06015 [Planctomycetota bacterium]
MPTAPLRDFVLGVDEAGYGPTLGPLVIAATVWEVPLAADGPAEFDFDDAFTGVVSRERAADGFVHVADSKAVHKAGGGIGPLERTALTLFGLSGSFGAADDDALFARLGAGLGDDPCRDGGPLALPREADADEVAGLAGRWSDACRVNGIWLADIGVRVVTPRAFNDGVARFGTKADVLTRTTLALITGLLGRQGVTLGAESGCGRVAVFADKHGGRSRYAGPLAEAAGGVLPETVRESRAESLYRFPGVDLRFTAKGESAMPVAAASCVAKYLRELAMLRFNRFWAERVAGLKPTKGYPVDAARFLADIEAELARSGLDRRAVRRSR